MGEKNGRNQDDKVSRSKAKKEMNHDNYFF